MAKLGRYSADRKKIQSISSAYTVSVADCGTIFLLTSNSYTITLPSAAAAGNGWWVKFIVAADVGSGPIVLDSGSDDTVELVAANSAGAAMTLGGGTDKVNIVNGSAIKGDQVEVVCDGTSVFYCLGTAAVAGALTTS